MATSGFERRPERRWLGPAIPEGSLHCAARAAKIRLPSHHGVVVGPWGIQRTYGRSETQGKKVRVILLLSNHRWLCPLEWHKLS